MNHIMIHGRLTRNPEQKSAGNGVVTKFTVAANRVYDRDTADFFDCDAWGKTGDFVQQYFGKGQEIIVTGEIQSRKYDDRDGNKRTSWSVNVEKVAFCGSKADKSSSAAKSDLDESASTEPPADDSDMPF